MDLQLQVFLFLDFLSIFRVFSFLSMYALILVSPDSMEPFGRPSPALRIMTTMTTRAFRELKLVRSTVLASAHIFFLMQSN